MKLNSFVFSGLVSLSVLAGLLTFEKPVMAQYYSAGETPKLVVDKKVRSLNQTSYSDNLDSSQYTFIEGESVDYSVIIRNSGNTELINIQMKDYLPKYLELVFSPGQIDQNNGQVNWRIGSLGVGESKVNTLRARIIGTNNKGSLLRLVNKVEARSGNLFDSDSAIIYVGSKSIPATGDNSIESKTIIGLVIGMVALLGRRIVRGYWG